MDPFFLATILIAVGILYYAYQKSKIDLSAAIASGVAGVLVLVSLGEYWRWLYLILAFFVIGNFITKYKYHKKEKRGVAEGIRTFRNVFGNGAAATIYAIFYSLTQSQELLFAFMGAMATAGADTFATEVGQAHEKNPRLITTLKKTHVGTSGAISTMGLTGALMGAGIISAVPLLLGEKLIIMFIGTLAGFVGCNIDSLLGATIEKKRLDKHMVNFIATLSGGIVAMLLSYLIL